MGTVPLGQILGSENLIGVIKRIASGLPNPFPPAFFTLTEDVVKDYAKVRTTTGQRKAAKSSPYGSPAIKAEKAGADERTVKLVHSFEYQQHGVDTLINLNQMDNPVLQDRGKKEVARQTFEFAQRFQNARISMVASMLANGKIYFNTDGAIATVSDNQVFTVDFNIPTAQTLSCDGIIATSWANTGADIYGHVRKLRRELVQLCGKPAKYAFYGSDVAGHILKNTTLANLLNVTKSQAEAMLRGETIPAGTLGLTWVDVSDAFHMSGDTLVEWFDPDALVITPEIQPDWYRLLEGSELIPSTMGAVGVSAEEMLGNLTEVQGMFSYATLTHNPVGVEEYFGDDVLPTCFNPGAMLLANVTP